MRIEADVTFVRCPTHGELVPVNRWRELLGRCSGCTVEAGAIERELTANLVGILDRIHGPDELWEQATA
jgi:hypothetical protein